MSERKVLNKYYPPNFDPSKIPRRRQPKNTNVFHEVRLMTPFSMRCNVCGEYIYKGKKFNAKKSTVEGESYYRIKIYRFAIRCPGCSAEITFKTDPASMDYVAESGAMRNFEPWRDEERVEEQTQRLRDVEETLNPIRALENKTVEAKKAMDVMEALDEIRTRNARNEHVPLDDLLHRVIHPTPLLAQQQQQQQQEMQEDAMLAKAAFQSTPNKKELPTLAVSPPSRTFATHPTKRKAEETLPWSHLVLKKKVVPKETPSPLQKPTTPTLQGLVGSTYDSDDEA